MNAGTYSATGEIVGSGRGRLSRISMNILRLSTRTWVNIALRFFLLSLAVSFVLGSGRLIMAHSATPPPPSHATLHLAGNLSTSQSFQTPDGAVSWTYSINCEGSTFTTPVVSISDATGTHTFHSTLREGTSGGTLTLGTNAKTISVVNPSQCHWDVTLQG